MAKKQTQTPPPATTIAGREDQLTALAFDAIEERIRSGQATGGELLYFAKLGSTRERLEKSMLEKQEELLIAKTETLRAQKAQDEMYAEVIEALKSYGGMHND